MRISDWSSDVCSSDLRLQRAQRRLAARTRTLHLDLEGAHAMLGGPLAGRVGSDLRGIRRRLARALEALAARRRPGNGVALRVGDGDHRVVERCIHMRDGRGDVLLFLAPGARGLVLAHEYPAVL